MIKNIIFDFGGVLLNLNYNKTFEELSKLMGLELKYGALPESLQAACDALEKGEMKPETFMWNIQKQAAKQITQPHKIIKAWNAMLLGWNPDRLPWLKDLRYNHRTFILSNTNEIHIDWVRKDLKTNHNVTSFENTYFEKVYYSHEMGKHKPDVNIYKQVIEDSKLVANETIFIDDNQANVDAAKAAGLHSVLHDPALEIIEMLPKYIRSLNLAISDGTV